MAVPKMSQLRPGIGVNIVLKADQRSGKLTTGQISEILTKGDHPRGIKVRLSTGQVGRVQSLSVSSQSSTTCPTNPYTWSSSGVANGQEDRGGQRERFSLQDDHRQDPTSIESRSLADYIRVPKSSKRNDRVPDVAPGETTIQAKLERDFPRLDSALIAAILADHEKIEDASLVLSAIS
ncbi:hypothetical protein P7C71_g4940, partial [Lecanoromycetidae sp. Uapishka_2]